MLGQVVSADRQFRRRAVLTGRPDQLRCNNSGWTENSTTSRPSYPRDPGRDDGEPVSHATIETGTRRLGCGSPAASPAGRRRLRRAETRAPAPVRSVEGPRRVLKKSWRPLFLPPPRSAGAEQRAPAHRLLSTLLRLLHKPDSVIPGLTGNPVSISGQPWIPAFAEMTRVGRSRVSATASARSSFAWQWACPIV